MKSRISAAGLILALAGSAQAEGLYLEAGGLLRKYDLSVAGAVNADSAKGYTLSPKLLLGYQFDETWSVEAAYAGLGAPGNPYTLGGQSGTLKADSHAWLLDVRGRYPLGGSLNLLGKAGLTHNSYQLDGSGEGVNRGFGSSLYALYLSAGLEYKFGPQWSLIGAFELYGKESNPGSVINGISVSAHYNF